MGPKPIHDVAPPVQAAGPPAEPSPGPEIVNDIPVRAPTAQASAIENPPATKEDDTSFIVPASSQPVANAAEGKSKIKNAKPKPILAIMVAAVAIICLAAGTYLKFLANN